MIETEHPENEADYYVGIAWDNGEKWFSVDTSGIPKEETIKIARSVKKIEEVFPMKMHQVAASILCMALLLALCLSAAYSEEIIPFAESGNNVQAILRFSNGKAISDGRVAKLEAGCTASTTVYVQAKSGSGWTTKASGSGGREASASCTAQND